MMARKMAAKGNKKNKGGRKKGGKNPHGGSDGLTPEEFKDKLCPAGPIFTKPGDEPPEAEPIDADFTKPKDYVDPVTFCLAVINHDTEVMIRCGVIQQPILEDKIMAAKIAAPYVNRKLAPEQPKKSDDKTSWSAITTEAENRLQNRMDINERASDPSRVN